jgi:uncharacterized protein
MPVRGQTNFQDSMMVSASALWFPIRDTARRPDPPPSPHWGFWGTFLWSTLIAIVFLATQILVLVIEIALSYHGKYTGSEFAARLQLATRNGNIIAHATIASTIVCCSLIAGVIKLRKRSTLKDYLCLYRVSGKTTVLWFGITLIFMVLSFLIFHFLKISISPQWMFDVYTTAHPVWVLCISILIAAPLSEEMFFRGFMFKGFQSSFLGPTGAIIITASLWAAIHPQYEFYGMIAIWCLGILLATARQMTGSLWIPLCIHILNNLCATVQVVILRYLQIY